MQRAAFFDVDGTLTKTNVWRYYIAYFKAHNIRKITHILFSITHYPLYYLKLIGLLKEHRIRSIWADHLAWYVKGLSEDVGNSIWSWVTEDLSLKNVWREDILAKLKDHQESGDIVILVSSGPEPLITAIGRSLGAQHVIGTRLEVRRHVFTGRSLKPICIDRFKASMAKAYLVSENLPIDLQLSFAYADSITDLSLLEMVGCPTVVYPDPELLAIAHLNDWAIVSGRG